MSAYTGFLIRRERLARNLSQEGLAKGICATSYLSKIEQGTVEPGQEIIDQLFAALGIDFIRDPALEAQAQQQLERFFFLLEAEEPTDEQEAFFEKNGDVLARSEFALSYQVVRLIVTARTDKGGDETRRMLKQLEPFLPCMSAKLYQWVLYVAAEFSEERDEQWAFLERAAQLGLNCLVAYKQATWAYRGGHYGMCVELAERAYALACEEGNTSAMIWSTFLLGTCACNHFDLRLACRYFDRTLALTRGHRENMSNYVNYNLGSTYLEIGDDDHALRFLEDTREVEGDEMHNVLLHQKLAILYQRKDEREKGLEHLALAKEHYALAGWDTAWRGTVLIGQMIRFAELTFEAEPTAHPEFERVTRALYDGAGEAFGFGFKRFYGRYLVDMYKGQRRYKEALLLWEEMSFR